MYPQPWAGKTEDTKVKQKKAMISLSSEFLIYKMGTNSY